MRRTAPFVLLLVLGMPATAGVNRWTEGGPPREECTPPHIHCSRVAAITLDPFDENVVYALMTTGPSDAPLPHGLWRSDDGGSTWTRIRFVPFSPYDQLVTIRVSPVNPQVLYILSEYALLRSTDGGNTWTKAELSENYVPGTDLVLDPGNSNTVYLAQESSCLFGGCIAGGVYRSDDGGRRWREIGLDEKTVWRLAIDPSDPRTLYAIVDDRRLFQTTNGGGSWKDITPPGSPVISMVAVDPVVSSTVYATTGSNIALATGLFKSTDRGRTWRLMGSDYFRDCERSIITIDAIHATHLLANTGFGSVIRSVDAGESWSLLSDGLEGVRGPVQLVIAPSGREFHAVFENGFIFHYSLVFPRRRAVAK